MQILCFKEEIIKVVSQSLICQTLLLNLTGDELGRGGRDQQDSGSQGSQKMSGSAGKKSDKRQGKLFCVTRAPLLYFVRS